MQNNFGRVLLSIYRSVYVLLLLRYAGMIYHRIFPKTDYDYENARMLIMAYYPKSGPGLLVFRSDVVCPEMLEWFSRVRKKMQDMLPNGKVRIVTEQVPPGEICLGISAGDVINRMARDGVTNKDGLARLWMSSAAEYMAIKTKYEHHA